jgi:hypothetical protein
MSIGAGIAIAGFLVAFVWAASISENMAAGVVIFGGLAALVAAHVG